MDTIKDTADMESVSVEALMTALGNNGANYFTYDVKNRTAYMPGNSAEKYGTGYVHTDMPYSMAKDFVREEDRDVFIEMYERIHAGENKATAITHSINGEWYKTTLTVTERDLNGKPVKAVGVSQDISVMKGEEEFYKIWLAALGETYEFRYLVDVTDGSFFTLEMQGSGPVKILPAGNFDERSKATIENVVFEDDRAECAGKINCEYISFHLGRKNRRFSVEYRVYNEDRTTRWVRATVALVDTKPDGSVHHAMFTTERIDKEREELALLQSSLALMRDTYYRIGCIDLNRNSMRTICISESERGEIPQFRGNFDKAIRDFAQNYVLEEYRDGFLNIMLPEKMKAIFDSGTEYFDITYRRLESGTPRWVRTELVPLRGYSPENRRVIWYGKNISDEKAIEDKLTKKLLQMNTEINLQLKTILDGISGGFKISIDDEKYSYYYISESTAELFGYSLEEFTDVTGNSALENVYPPDRDILLKSMKACKRGNDNYTAKYRVKCRDGSLKWIVDSGKRVTVGEGKSMFYSLYQDVTEMETRNAELNNALTMINQILAAVDCGIIAYRMPDRQVMLLNDEVKRMFERSEPDASSINMGEMFKDSILPEDYAEIGKKMKEFRDPGDSVAYKFRIRRRDGTVCWTNASSNMLNFEDGNKYVLTTITDVTEQSELYEILQEERMQFRDALLSNCEYAFFFDLTEGMVNNEFVTAHGINPFRELGVTVPIPFDELLEAWVSALKPRFIDEGNDLGVKREVLLEKFAEGQRSVEVEFYSPTSDIYLRMTVLLSRSKRTGHVMAVVLANDTTESRKKEEVAKKALEEAYEAAKRANSAKSDFLSRMSHDIRTPMNAIIGMTAIAGTHLDERDRVVDCLDKITSSSSHLLSLINEVLDMSKIESGKIDLCEEEFNLSDLIDNLISMVRPDVKAKKQELGIHISDIEHEKVIGDSLRIQQSFINLMSNAIKYTPSGGMINLYIREKPAHSDNVGTYEFIFEDNGIGMEPEFLKHIFEPFVRADDSRVSKIQGTGLGLAITENLVRMMDGSIEVESAPGKGTKFTVTITLRLQSDEDEALDDKLNGLSVLVADDEAATCEFACHLLDEIGVDSEWVTTGEAAANKVEERHKSGSDYFAVILDWKMPGMDGVETTREIRRRVGKDVPIIIISSFDWTDIEMEARAAGADAFIGKPLFRSRLNRLFRDMVSGRRSERSDVEKSADKIAEASFPGKRVLLAEDNELNAEIVVELLKMMSIEVDCAENGRIAVDMFEKSASGCYDLVLMDIQMPVLNGNEATRAIRSLDRRDAKGVPIVAMTANAFAEDVQAALSAGMNQHISKPIDMTQFVAMLKKWLS